MIKLLSLVPLAGKAFQRLINAPGRDALARAKAEYVAAVADIARIEGRIDRLTGIIAAQPAAEAALTSAVMSDDAAELEQFARGNSAGMGEIIVNADAAARAAQIARNSLPQAQKELEAARNRVRELEVSQRRKVGAVLIEHCDVIGEEYVATFRHLCKLHDQLVGLARGTTRVGGRDDIVLANLPLEVPRFKLPSMPTLPDGIHRTLLQHIPDGRRIGAMVTACCMAANRLLDEPYADITEFFSEEAFAQSAEIKEVPGHRREITLHQKHRPPEPSVNEIQYPSEDRTRHKIELFRVAG